MWSFFFFPERKNNKVDRKHEQHAQRKHKKRYDSEKQINYFSENAHGGIKFSSGNLTKVISRLRLVYSSMQKHQIEL